MDPRLKEIAENFDKKKIGLDDTFKFHCTQCGKCCTEREDILLSARDVYNMSKELGMAPIEMTTSYCEWYIGADSRFPIIRIKPRGPIRRCPLMKDRKCSVHKAKPLVCAMFPLGRATAFQKNEYNIESIRDGGIQYIFNKPNCGDDSETFTVREYLESFGIPADDAFFFSWQEMLCEVTAFIHEAEKRLGDEVMNELWTTIMVGIYLCYDIERPFDEQFEENKRGVLELIQSIQRQMNEMASA